MMTLALVACGDENDTNISSTSANLLSDATSAGGKPSGGTIGFYFLSPFNGTLPGSFPAVFNGTLQQRSSMDVFNINCGTGVVGSLLTTFPKANVGVYPNANDALSKYRVTIATTIKGLLSPNCYRLIPKLDGNALGFRDIQITNGTATAGFTKVLPGASQPVDWRVEGNLDADGDGVLNNIDNCQTTPNANQADSNSNGIGDVCEVADADGDGVLDSVDNCVNTPNANQANADGDAAGDACDSCPADANKIVVGQCGCGVADTDSDGDGTANCNDGCPNDANKVAVGQCGCGVADTDSDGDGTANCNDGCPNDALKTAPGQCGCGIRDTDTDGDGRANCLETCDPNFLPG